MAVELRTQLFDLFGGESEGIHSIILPDIFSSGGSLNIWMDRYGRAKKIDGYSAQGSAVTTNTGGTATRIRNLFPYRQTVGGSLTRQLMGVFDDAVDEWELHFSTNNGATYTFIADLGSSSINTIADFVQFGDTLYITNGVIAPRAWDGSALTTAGRTQSPTITAAAAGTAGELTGNYQWKLLSIINGARQAGSVPSTSLALQDNQGSLSWTIDANTNVDGYELYRTTGTGSVYYFVTYIDLRATVSHTDTVADIDILENRVMEEHGDSPPSGAYFCEAHKQRVWWGRVDAHPTRAYWSDPGLPEDVLADNFFDFADGETMGDFITGMVGNFEGRLIVLTELGVWTISGTGSIIGNIQDWTRTRTNAQIGSVSHRTAVRIPAGARYADQKGEIQVTRGVTLAYLTPLKDIRIFDGEGDTVISYPKKETFDTINHAQRAKSFAISDIERAEVTWVFAAGSAGEPATAVTWNWRWGIWYERSWPFTCGVALDSSTDSSFLLAGEGNTATGGITYLLWDGNSFNGSDIESAWMTKTLHGANDEGQPVLSQIKRWRWADFLFETEQNTTLTVEWLAGYAPDNGAGISSVAITPAAVEIVSAGDARVVDASGNPVVVGQSTTTARALLKDSTGSYLHDTGVRIKVGDNATAGSWSLEALNLAYQVLPGLQRRMQ